MHCINITTITSYTSHIAITSSLHHHYIVITFVYTIAFHYITITSPLHHLHCHYSTITFHYITITSPLHSITSPLHHHCITIASPLHLYTPLHYHYILISSLFVAVVPGGRHLATALYTDSLWGGHSQGPQDKGKEATELPS